MYYKRELLETLEKWLDRREIYAIRGPRQSGKTTILKIIKQYLIDNKIASAEHIIDITFEDRDVLEKFALSPKDFVKSYIGEEKEKKFYFFIDEAQYLEQVGQKLKLLYDLFENIKFIITGSSSLELKDQTAKYLVGRVFYFDLFQFNLSELLNTKEKNLFNHFTERHKILQDFLIYAKDIKNTEKDIFINDINKCFEEYVLFGGYPEVIKTNDIETKKMILKNIFDTYVSKDIIDLLRLPDAPKLKNLLKILANQVGSLINYSNLLTDSLCYYKELKQYLAVLEETFIINLIRPYFTNQITELKKNPKCFFMDCGLRNYLIDNFNELKIRPDQGQLIENAVFVEMKKNFSGDIKYWRTLAKAEVDFVLQKGSETIPIEVKYSHFDNPQISRSFRSFLDKYNPSRALILTKDYWQLEKMRNTNILFAPACYF